jgi:hypothetical protein
MVFVFLSFGAVNGWVRFLFFAAAWVVARGIAIDVLGLEWSRLKPSKAGISRRLRVVLVLA